LELAAHPSYQRLVQVARRCHSAGRCPYDIKPKDIDLARLYSHAYRAHVIGTFHATRLAIEALTLNDRASTRGPCTFLLAALGDLADLAMDPIMPDMRALLGTFQRYDQGVRRAIDGLEQLLEIAGDGRLDRIARRFRAAVEAISSCSGIALTQDTVAPEQASFVVPNLGITIVPLVYGDYHSWNLAWLTGLKSDVPVHHHREGVEIHLGYPPMQGETILGKCRAEVSDGGYAMPIPPLTAHGYVNRSKHEHHVPFVYGSLKAGGWGVFLDVEPQPCQVERLKKVDLKSREMNGSIALEPALAQVAALGTAQRRVLIPAKATDRNGCGGLELAAARITAKGLELPVDSFRAVSVVRGEGMVDIAGIEQPIKAHDHFGIPAGMTAALWQKGREPLVLLDALIRATGR
jgi:hypothetical protein